MKSLIFFLVVLIACSPSENSSRYLRVNVQADPYSLDPRIGVDRRSQVFSRLLYEGLTRMQPDGSMGPGVAQRVQISKDKKTYTFFLRDSYWTNGEPVTAYDFEYAWKEVLRPNSEAPLAEALFVIKNAKAAKIGEVEIDEIGVRALDAKTLEVQLEHPTSYFLELTSNGQYFPVLHTLDQTTPKWSRKPSTHVCNGPFKIQTFSPNEKLIVEKNPTYWDANRVKLDGVAFSIVSDSNSVYQLYENQELDWAGEPFSQLSIETITHLQKTGKLLTRPVEAVFLFTFDTRKAPFTSQKMRKAFSYAIDRECLIHNTLKGGEEVVTSLLPPGLTLQDQSLFVDGDRIKARQLFDEALLDLNLTRKEISPLIFDYADIADQKMLSQALQQHWQDIFDIKIQLRGHDWNHFVSSYYGGDFTLAGAQIYSFYHDPTCLLNAYRIASNRVNAPYWESKRFIQLLDLADNEADITRRDQHLKEAEALLVDEMPLAPVFAGTYKYTKRDRVKGVFISDAGYVDFRWAYLE